MAKYRFRAEKRSGGGEYSKRIRHVVTIGGVDYRLRMKDEYCCCDCTICTEHTEKLELTIGGVESVTGLTCAVDNYATTQELLTAAMNDTYILDRDNPIYLTFTKALGVSGDYGNPGVPIGSSTRDELSWLDGWQFEEKYFLYTIEAEVQCTVISGDEMKLEIVSVIFGEQIFQRARSVVDRGPPIVWSDWSEWAPPGGPIYWPIATQEILYGGTAPTSDLFWGSSCDDPFGGKCVSSAACNNLITFDDTCDSRTDIEQAITLRARLQGDFP